MSVQTVKNIFKKDNLENLVIYNKQTSSTVEEAAKLIGCNKEEIAKTMAFLVDNIPIVIVSSGLARIDNAKYKNYFKKKAKMIPYNEVEKYLGHLPGGVGPFGLKENVKVYLDISLKKFTIVYAGGGDEYNTVKVTIKQLEKYSNYIEWVDVCKN